MADLTPKTFAEAQSTYQGRKCKVLGRRIRPTAWMRLDEQRNCFVLTEVMQKRGPGYKLLPREQWVQKPFAEIYPDRIEILREVHNNYIWRMGLYHQRSVTNKFAGRSWKYKGEYQGNGETPLTLKNGKISFSKPPAQRVVDNELRKEMNRMITKIRALFKVRSKLGAFETVTFAQLADHAKFKRLPNRYEVLGNGKRFLEILQEVDENDITSFYSLMWLIHPYHYWYGCHLAEHVAPDQLLRLFNLTVNGRREAMRKTLGVVKYAEVAETVEAPAEACGSS